MKIIEYVYFEKPGEKEKMQEIAKKSLNVIDMSGRIMTEFDLSVQEANIVANKFFKK